MTTPLFAACSRKFFAHYHGLGRRASEVKWVILHSTEGSTAAGAAGWFENPESQGSAHKVVDDRECYQTLPDLTIAYAAPGANEKGLHLEIAGYAAWRGVNWHDHEVRLNRAAYITAQWCLKYKIPPRWVGPIGLRLGRKGISTHRACSYAWPALSRKTGFHTDPGLGFPKTYFLGKVKHYMEGRLL